MPTLHPLCTDHAVLSAARPAVFGTAAPGLSVHVRLGGLATSTVAGSDGRWHVVLPATVPGGPHRLVAEDSTGVAMAHDILVGEVWLGSGQSNMEWPLRNVAGSESELAGFDEPRLRVFTVGRACTPQGEAHTVEGRWQVATPETASAFSAVGAWFSRTVLRETGRPQGLVVSAWGGSPIAAWLHPRLLWSRPEYASFAEAYQAAKTAAPDATVLKPHADLGRSPATVDWHAAGFDDSTWDWLQVPGSWQSQGWVFNGAVWYRTRMAVPEAWQGRDLMLDLGICDDFDQAWVNGVAIGSTGPDTSSWWAVARSYRIPAVLATGTIDIVVRVFDQWGDGGVMGAPRLRLEEDATGTTVRCPGSWRAKAELELPLRAPSGINALSPASLYQGMIAPLAGLGLDGVLWYQGESDTGRALLYQRLLTDLIRMFRRHFAHPDLPVGIVSLAAFKPRKNQPSWDDWANLREAQRRTVATVPHTGLIVTLDLGEADNIHPRAKRPVGERLARWALRTVYGRHEVVPSGPEPVECWREGVAVRIRFRQARGLAFRDGRAAGFEVEEPDGTWVWAATATIDDDTVRLTQAGNLRLHRVRYAWQANPEAPLVNGAGLPAGPFELTIDG